MSISLPFVCSLSQAPNITHVFEVDASDVAGSDVSYCTLVGRVTVAWGYAPSEVPVVEEQVGVGVIVEGGTLRRPMRLVRPSLVHAVTVFDDVISQSNRMVVYLRSENIVGLSSTAASNGFLVGTSHVAHRTQRSQPPLPVPFGSQSTCPHGGFVCSCSIVQPMGDCALCAPVLQTTKGLKALLWPSPRR